MKKYIILSLITIFATPFFSTLANAQDAIRYFTQKPKWSFKKKSNILDYNRSINWSQLVFKWKNSTGFELDQKDNVISKPIFIKQQYEKEFRQKIYKDILTIPIDYELTVERLALLNDIFRDSLLSKLYQTDLFELFDQSEMASGSYIKFPFTGQEGLIDLVLKSHYYQKEDPLKVVPSLYEANRYNMLVIETRNLGLKPSLFPKIYTYDKNGKIMLVYALGQSNWKFIVQNGFAKFYFSEKDVTERSTFYISALKVLGDLENDVIISRDDYLKFFASPVSLMNLSQGKLAFIVSKENIIHH